MKIFFAFFLVILTAFGGYHLSFRRVAGRSSFAWLHLTGLEFLAIGLLFGPHFLNILDDTTVASLEPLTALALGWIGLLLGFQFEASQLRKFPPAFFMAMLIQSLVTVLISFIFLYISLPFIVQVSGSLQLVTALALSAAAACSSQSGLAMIISSPSGRAYATVRLLRYMASLDGLVPMILLVFIFIVRGRPEPAGLSDMLYLPAAALAAVFAIYMCFFAARRGTDELALIIIAMVVLTSGAAAMIGFSPLLANFFMGIILVNLTREKEKIFHLLASIEKPVYLALLIFLGAGWHLPDFWIALPAVAYWFVRAVGKTAGAMAGVRLLPALKDYPGFIGLGLMEQGGLAVAILFDFKQRFPLAQTSYTVSFAVAAIVLAQLASPYFSYQVIKRAD